VNAACVQVLQALQQQQQCTLDAMLDHDGSTAAVGNENSSQQQEEQQQPQASTPDMEHSAPDELYAQLVQLGLLRR
jgi:hypothetical protein